MLQLIVIYYGPGLAGTWAQGVIAESGGNFFLDWLATWSVFDRFLAVMIGFVINYACYFSEIYRGGIQSISKGQYEAGEVLGMTKSQIFFRVILLQVIKRIIPPMSNEIITLVKETSVVSFVGATDLYTAFAYIANINYEPMIPYLMMAVIYIVIIVILTLIIKLIERRLRASDRK